MQNDIRNSTSPIAVVAPFPFPFVTIDHPISSATQDVLMERARKAASASINILTGPTV